VRHAVWRLQGCVIGQCRAPEVEDSECDMCGEVDEKY
jgi:hypothetical protein